MNCPVEVLIKRDVKGLYKKALSGEIKQFTGISDPYESPAAPELTIDSSKESIESSVTRILHSLEKLQIIPSAIADLPASPATAKSVTTFS